jgi:hypothetical protein
MCINGSAARSVVGVACSKQPKFLLTSLHVQNHKLLIIISIIPPFLNCCHHDNNSLVQILIRILVLMITV